MTELPQIVFQEEEVSFNQKPRARFSKTLRFGVEPVEWLENLIDDLEGDGFLESNVLLVRQKLYVRILSHIQRGGNIESFYSEEMSCYMNWVNVVLNDEEAATTGRNRSNSLSNSPKAAQTQLQELLLWYLIYNAMGNLKSLSNFRCFLFHESLKARVLKDKSPGQWVRDQVGSWYETLRQNTNRRKERKKPMYKFLNYDDVDGLFASKQFIRAWLDPKQKEQISKDLVGDKYKTFLEKSNAHLFGLISYLSCFRNYYFLVIATIVQLTIVWTLTMEWWYVKLAAGAVLAGLCIGFKFLLDLWLRPSNAKARAAKRPDSVASAKPLKEVVVVDDSEATASSSADQLIKRKKTAKDYLREAASITSLLVILCVKSGFDWGLLKLAELQSFGESGHPIHQVVLWFLVFSIYFLDTYFFYQIHVAIVAFVAGKINGVDSVQCWSDLYIKLPQVRAAFESKVLSVKGREEYTPAEKYVAWARFWNQSLYDMYRNDYLSLTELERLSYEITEESEEVSNLLSGSITRGPKFYPKPSCNVAMERLIDLANTFLVKSMPVSSWRIGELPITTSIIQVHNNDPIIYSEEDICRNLNTGRSVLAQLIFTHPNEWDNFLRRLKVNDAEIQVLNNMINGKMIFPEFVKTEDDDGRTIEDLVLQVRLWASARLQTISRSIKGALSRREAYCFLAKLQYPEYDDEKIESLVSEKLQIIVSFQTFNSGSLREALAPANIGKITTLPKREEELHNALLYYSTPACLRTCGVEVSHVVNENGSIYAVLLSGDVLDEIHRTWLPGLPILCEEGEGDYISCALGFARGEYVQSVPHLSDGFFEQEIKFPNLLAEFQNDSRVVSVGVRDKVCSHDYNTFGRLQALKDKEEVAAQRVQSVYGTRLQKASSSSSGSSDVFSSRWVEGEGEGMGKASYISEEIYSSYATFLKEKRSVSVEYLQEAKFKDVGLLPITRTITKAAAGTAQQLYTRWTYWINTSRRVSVQKKFHLAAFGVGSHYQSVMIKYAFVIFVLSAVVTYLQHARNGVIQGDPIIYLLGCLWMLWLGQLASPSVLTELMLEKGILKGVFYYLLWLVPLFVFNLFNMMTRASGFADGILSQAKYIATGRPFSLEHLPFRNIYSTFKASHLYLSFILSFIIFGFVYFLHPTVYALLSTLLVCLSIWMILPFVTNPGSTAWNTPVKVWLMLLYDDWRDYIRFQEKIILYNRHILWPSLFVIFVGAATFFQFDIKLYWVMLLVGIYIGLLTPWLKLFYFIIGFVCILSQTLIGFATLPFILAFRYSLKKSQVRRAPWLYDEKYGMLSALKYQPDTQTTNSSDKTTRGGEKHNVFSLPPTITISPTSVEGTVISPGEYPVERRLKMRLARQNTFGFDRLKPVLVPAANPQPLECDTECNGPLHEHIQQLKGDGANVTLLPSHSFLDKPEVMMAHTTASKSLNKHIENLKHKETRQSPKIGRTTLFNESPLMGRRVQHSAKEKSEEGGHEESNRNHEVEIVVDEEIVETSPLVRRG